MILTTVTPPTAEPIDATLLAQHLRLDDVAGQESVVAGIIATVRERAEAVTWRALMRQTLRLTLDAFPSGREAIIIPRPPLASVTGITYVDEAGITRTLDPAAYLVDAASEPGRIVPAPGTLWPATQAERPGAVSATYTAGYASAAAVPACIKQWLLLNAAALFEHRETFVVGQRAQMVELATLADGLLEPVKVRWY